MLTSLSPKVLGIVEAIARRGRKIYDAAISQLVKLPSSVMSRLPACIVNVSTKLAHILRLLILFFWWCFIQFWAIWLYGGGNDGVEVLYFMAFAARRTYDLTDLKLINQHLVLGPEMAWGFGQVLCLVLLTIIIFSAIDAVAQS